MRKCLIVAAALAAAMLADSRPSHAYADGPWCAVVSTGTGSIVEQCDFWDFERCRLEVISGNRGFCRQNQYWPGYYERYDRRPRVSQKRKRR
jgi:hypothetical protein